MPEQQPAPALNAPVQAPFQGLFLDRPAWVIPPTGLQACQNVRIALNKITSSNMGWTIQFSAHQLGLDLTLGQVFGGGLFTLETKGQQYLIIVTDKDVIAYTGKSPPAGFFGSGAPLGPVYITPTYTTGTAACAGTTTVTGVGTMWNTASGTGFRNNVRVGDYISFTANANSPTLNTWFKISSVGSDTSLGITTNSPPNTGGQVSYTIRQCMSNNNSDSIPVMETFPNAGGSDNQDIIFIANNGGAQRLAPSVDPIFTWNPVNRYGTYMTGYSFTCGQLRRFQNVLVYGRLWGVSGLTPSGWLGGTSIQSSDNGLPKSLNTGVAFQGIVSDGAEPIQHLGILGNSLLIYMGTANWNASALSASTASGSVISATFVGLPTVWQFATVVRARGPIGQNLVAEFSDRHQFIGVDGEYRYNGLFLQVMNDHVWRGILPALDYNALSNSFHVHAPTQGELIWVVPYNSGQAVELQAFTEHYMEQANNYLFKPYTMRDAGNNAQLYQWNCFIGSNPSISAVPLTGFQGPLIGDSFGNVIQLYSGFDTQTFRSGTTIAYPSSAQFASRIVAGERARGLIKRVYPYVEQSSGAYNLTVTLMMQDRIGGSTTITDTQTIAVNNPANRFTTHYRRGRVANVTFSTAGNALTGQPWTLDGYDWELPHGSPGGQR